jgi:hypothetical protein
LTAKNALAYFVLRAVEEEKHFVKMPPKVLYIKPLIVANDFLSE